MIRPGPGLSGSLSPAIRPTGAAPEFGTAARIRYIPPERPGLSTTISKETRMSMMQEFKKFAMRGNVLDMAVGIIIGAAFGTIVSSLVADVIMPPIGILLGGIDFSSFALTIKEATPESPAVLIKYGVFINAIINFLIVAFAIFLLIRGFNKLQKQEAPAPAAPTTKECPECSMTIPLAAKRCGHCTAVLAR
jgi:large conductance mechanosensitive channel